MNELNVDLLDLPSYSQNSSAKPRQPVQNEHPNAHLLPNWDSCGVPTEINYQGTKAPFVFRRKRLFQGRTARKYSFPWVAQLYATSVSVPLPSVVGNDKIAIFYAMGALINDRYILTSASAVHYIGKSYTIELVALGGSRVPKFDSNPDFIGIEEIIIHKEYVESVFKHNLALIRLDKPVNNTPVCLPIHGNTFPDSEWESARLTVVGLGSVSAAPATKFYPDYLQYTNVRLQNKSDCDRVYSRQLGKLEDDSVCASKDGVSPVCDNDDGAPLMACRMVGTPPKCANFIQVGVTSSAVSSDTCGNQGFPGVFTKLSSYSYIPWILDNIRE